jgi:metal-dependent amidase/aminoacylase/carboxypeptidase family protein
VPGSVQFSLDIRSKEDAKVLQLERLLKEEFAKIASGEEVNQMNTQGTRGRGCIVDWQLDTDSPATKFHKDCIECVEKSAADMIGTESDKRVQRMTSGAGHDR